MGREGIAEGRGRGPARRRDRAELDGFSAGRGWETDRELGLVSGVVPGQRPIDAVPCADGAPRTAGAAPGVAEGPPRPAADAPRAAGAPSDQDDQGLLVRPQGLADDLADNVWATDPDAPSFRFTIKDMRRTFGLSRATLIYYEEHGILHPRREEGNDWRIYSEADVFRLMSAAILKGMGQAPGSIARLMDGDPFDQESFERYRREADRRIAYQRTLRAAIDRLAFLRDRLGQVGVVDVPRYYICWDQAEHGYHDFPATRNLDLLMEHMPVGGLGSRYEPAGEADGRDGPRELENRWGRTVRVADAGLIDGFDEQEGPEAMAVIGGMRCVCAVLLKRHMYPAQDACRATRSARSAASAYARRHGLEIDHEHAFSPFSLPTEEGFLVPMCVPAVGATGARSAIRRLLGRRRSG